VGFQHLNPLSERRTLSAERPEVGVMPKKPQDDDGFPTSAELSRENPATQERRATPESPEQRERKRSYLEALNELRRRRNQHLITKQEFEKQSTELSKKYADVLRPWET
jgi:hypothetical protein